MRKVLRVIAWTGLVCSLIVIAVAGPPLWTMWQEAGAEAQAVARDHQEHRVAHPGWSFPARVWSDSVPLEGTPRARLLLEAEARDYAARCPATEPGQFCRKTGDVIPRGGRFPEGVQPAGTEGWTRPLALEPIRIGTLVGPDAELREHLPLDQAPKHLVGAIIAAEDERFRDHIGISPVAMLRAAWVNAQAGHYAQGASTLTMQVVRNLVERKEKNLERKLREALLAIRFDALVGKDGILQIYLDMPYLGQAGSQSISGFAMASRHYLGKDVRDITMAEAALLAGLLPAPGKLDPNRNPQKAKERRDFILGRMKMAGWEIGDAVNDPLPSGTHPVLPPDLHPAYLQATRAYLESRLKPEVVTGAGLDVWTAMDVHAQRTSEAVLADKTRWFEQILGRRGEGPLQSAGVLLDVETGRLLAVYGGAQEISTDLNRATQARRQAGSSFKPLVYALGFSRAEASGGPVKSWELLGNLPRVFENKWSPRNVGGKYNAKSTVAQGLTWSQNIATTELLVQLGGPKPLIELANRFGFDTRAYPEELGLGLGQGEVTPLEMGRFVTSIAAGGVEIDGSPVIVAVDAAGSERLKGGGHGAAVLTPQAAALTRDLMRLVVDHGTGGASRGAAGIPGVTGPALGKTGTADAEKDLWFIGATPRFAASVWLGYDQPARIGASASDLAAPLWGWWMRALLDGLENKGDFPGEKLAHKWVCNSSGLLSRAGCPALPVPVVAGEGPRGTCTQPHSAAELAEEPVDDDVDGDAIPADPNAPPAPAGAPPAPGAAPAEKPKPKGHQSLWAKRAAAASAPKPAPAPAPTP